VAEGSTGEAFMNNIVVTIFGTWSTTRAGFRPRGRADQIPGGQLRGVQRDERGRRDTSYYDVTCWDRWPTSLRQLTRVSGAGARRMTVREWTTETKSGKDVEIRAATSATTCAMDVVVLQP